MNYKKKKQRNEKEDTKTIDTKCDVCGKPLNLNDVIFCHICHKELCKNCHKKDTCNYS